MADNYVQAAFAVTMTAAEAKLVAACEEAIDILDAARDDQDEIALGLAFGKLGPDFAAAFPRQPHNPFRSFAAIFDDPDFICLGAEIFIGEPEENGLVTVSCYGSHINPDNVAALFFHCAKSALPFGFEYAWTCDKFRLSEFGGGAVFITTEGLQHFNTNRMLDEALAKYNARLNAPQQSRSAAAKSRTPSP